MSSEKKLAKDGETYWSMVEPYWDNINIYDGPEEFSRTFATVPRVAALLYAAHFCQSEVCNGGFDQFFWNSTGVLGPEAVEAFNAIGMPRTADLLHQAMASLGEPYPRDREERIERLEQVDPSLLDRLDETFFELIGTESGGFRKAADRLAQVTHN